MKKIIQPTYKQIKFCEGVIEGLTYKEAYLAAFPLSSDKLASQNGSLLLKKKHIIDYINELKFKFKKPLQEYGRDEMLQDLINIKNTAIEKKNPLVALRAIEQLTKVLGYNEPDKVINKHIVTNVEISKLFEFED